MHKKISDYAIIETCNPQPPLIQMDQWYNYIRRYDDKIEIDEY